MSDYSSIFTGEQIDAILTKANRLNADGGVEFATESSFCTGNAGSATILQSGRIFSISDNDSTNTGPNSLSFNGSDNLNIKLPDTIKATLTGNADTATTSTNATNIYSSPSITKAYVLGTQTADAGNHPTTYNPSVYTQGSVLYGAAWNDYAEYRRSNIVEAGRCVVEVGNDELILSSERMIPGGEIISDTFGFAIGKTNLCNTPIAVSGRVLAYPYESLEIFKNNIGKPVCSGPNGTVSLMNDEEYKEKGYCAVGFISSIPEYDIWGENNIKVNGRVWIRVR